VVQSWRTLLHVIRHARLSLMCRWWSQTRSALTASHYSLEKVGRAVTN
jgi:hypothetical protein